MLHLLFGFHHPVYTYCADVVDVLFRCEYHPEEAFSLLTTLYSDCGFVQLQF